MKLEVFAFFLLAAASQVTAHVTMLGAVNEPKSRAFGVQESTPLDCTARNPCQRDSSIISRLEQMAGISGPCGRTLAKGTIDISASLAKFKSEGIPIARAEAGKTFAIRMHTINADGAGPFSCSLDTSGLGTQWQTLEVVQNIPGVLGINPLAALQDRNLVVQMPANVNCAGEDSTCIIRCLNRAVAGPFGGCMPIQMGRVNAEPNRPAQPNNPNTPQGPQNNLPASEGPAEENAPANEQ
ncbi:hypothetical protein BKA69DRAFT_1120713 [Paraphysoderma sedebokerense]|nr:hypothetical protein BKA69DRAFT_1120713 [Paraphysoderma sedebokerense]